nr:sn1-specific diacylglycerol lipase beta-like [Coffea arabica]
MPIALHGITGLALRGTKEKLKTLALFMGVVCCTTVVQCCAGSDVLRWRSFYATEGNLWKAHYQEVFDHGIREAFCCLGRVKYLTALEEDEIYSVAQLLGDLVTYRATGTGHLELLAGLALLQKCRPFTQSHEELLEIPPERVHEAAVFHQFAEAAYTGLLLDVGRNPLMFPCAWLYRQGIFSLWSRNRRPAVEGDNWWRGHAAAFLKHVKSTPDALRKGRINQGKCKASYFMMVLHHLKSVVIAVRGTETPEDLITDGLCRECCLSKEDLDGLINDGATTTMVSSLSYYGHSGVIEAAQDLYMQIEGNSTQGSETCGYLSSLLGEGCECEGYNLRIVGHSLGGAIAAVLGFRLYRRYPKLHVYAYGPLPCLDLNAADACSNFVTSVILNNEFSARLSVASIMRLRAAAIDALSQDSIARSAIVSLAHRYFSLNGFSVKDNKMLKEVSDFSSLSKVEARTTQTLRQTHQYGRGEEDLESCWEEIAKEDSFKPEISLTDSKPNYDDLFSPPNVCHYDDQFKLAAAIPSSETRSSHNVPEMFVPGLVIHIVPVKEHVHHPLLKRFSIWEEDCSYKAYIAKRESFKDIIVSPSMFLDHLPWRCYRAIRKVLDSENLRSL